MKRSILLAGLLAALALAGVGCTSGRQGGGPTYPEPPAPRVITQADAGEAQRLKLDQRLVVELPGNPTTGYQWVVSGRAPAQLRQMGEPKFEADSSALGAGGTVRLTFLAVKRGPGRLRLEYVRTFEATSSPAEPFSVDVVVR